MRRVIIESPYAGDVERNLRYLRAAMRDCLDRDEAPFASHGLYTQPGVLDDAKPEERRLGIEAGFAWRLQAEMTAVYTDLGTSIGMEFGIGNALELGHPIEYRQLGGLWDVTALNDHDFVGDECDCALCGEGWCHYLHDKHRQRVEAQP